MSVIRSSYVDISACARVKWSEKGRLRIDSGVRQGCIMSLWLLYVYMDGVMKEMNVVMGRRGVRFLEDGRGWRFPDPLYADELVLCGE